MMKIASLPGSAIGLTVALLLAACGGGTAGPDAAAAPATAMTAAASDEAAATADEATVAEATTDEAAAPRATASAVFTPPPQRYLKPNVTRIGIYSEPTTLALFDPRGAGSVTSLGSVASYGWGVFDSAIPRAGAARELAGAARLFYLRPAVANQPAGIYRVKLGFNESHAPEFLFAACATVGSTVVMTARATEPDGRRGVVSFLGPDCATGVAYLVDDQRSTLLPGGAIADLQVLADPFTGKTEKLLIARTLADGRRVLRVTDADGSHEAPIAGLHASTFGDGNYADYAFGAPDQTRRALYTADAQHLYAITWNAHGATETTLALPGGQLRGLPMAPTWTSDASAGWYLDGGTLIRAQGSDLPTVRATLPEDAIAWGTNGGWNTPGHVLGLARIQPNFELGSDFSALYSVNKRNGAVTRLDAPGWHGTSNIVGVRGERVVLARQDNDLPAPNTSLVVMNADGTRLQTLASGVDVVGVLSFPVWHRGEPRQGLSGNTTGASSTYTTQATSVIYCTPAAGAANCFERGGTLFEFRFELLGGRTYRLGDIAAYSRRGFPTLGFRIRDGRSNGRYLIEAGEIYGPFPMRLYSARPQTAGSLTELITPDAATP